MSTPVTTIHLGTLFCLPSFSVNGASSFCWGMVCGSAIRLGARRQGGRQSSIPPTQQLHNKPYREVQDQETFDTTERLKKRSWRKQFGCVVASGLLL